MLPEITTLCGSFREPHKAQSAQIIPLVISHLNSIRQDHLLNATDEKLESAELFSKLTKVANRGV